jgi:hypothetical protein
MDANHYATDGVNSHRKDDNINMDETKEPVNDRNELTNLHYASRHTSSAVDRGLIIISMIANPIGGVMVSVFTSSAGRSWVLAYISSNQRQYNWY